MSKFVVAGLSVLGILFLASLEAVDFLGTAIAGLVVVGAAASGATVMLWGLVRRKHFWTLAGATVLAAVLASVLAGRAIQRRQVDESLARGELLASALSAHQKRHGYYPLSLEALVPDFIPEVPCTAMGFIRRFEFEYHAPQASEYSLWFMGPASTGQGREETGGWTWFD